MKDKKKVIQRLLSKMIVHGDELEGHAQSSILPTRLSLTAAT